MLEILVVPFWILVVGAVAYWLGYREGASDAMRNDRSESRMKEDKHG